ncbi:hypothetical protein AAG570_001414 [Ranatra chinensis]|uniref:Uncharacterized protein n=1 Tax=Ranatra chinensis TaxID=642074 RepID=A0ABD0YY78_9HEMI
MPSDMTCLLASSSSDGMDGLKQLATTYHNHNHHHNHTQADHNHHHNHTHGHHQQAHGSPPANTKRPADHHHLHQADLQHIKHEPPSSAAAAAAALLYHHHHHNHNHTEHNHTNHNHNGDQVPPTTVYGQAQAATSAYQHLINQAH